MTLKEKKLLAIIYMEVYKAVKGRRVKTIARNGWFEISYSNDDGTFSGECVISDEELLIKLSLLSAQLSQGVDTIIA